MQEIQLKRTVIVVAKRCDAMRRVIYYNIIEISITIQLIKFLPVCYIPVL